MLKQKLYLIRGKKDMKNAKVIKIIFEKKQR